MNCVGGCGKTTKLVAKMFGLSLFPQVPRTSDAKERTLSTFQKDDDLALHQTHKLPLESCATNIYSLLSCPISLSKQTTSVVAGDNSKSTQCYAPLPTKSYLKNYVLSQLSSPCKRMSPALCILSERQRRKLFVAVYSNLAKSQLESYRCCRLAGWLAGWLYACLSMN